MVTKLKVATEFFTLAPLEGNWVEGTYLGFKYQAKIFVTPSDYGIKGARRISKLWIQDKEIKETVLNYDRGWDVGYKTRGTFKGLMERLEMYAQTTTFTSRFPSENV